MEPEFSGQLLRNFQTLYIARQIFVLSHYSKYQKQLMLMMELPETLKSEITMYLKWLANDRSNLITYRDGRIHPGVYQLLHHIHSSSKELDLSLSLNAEIYSASIEKSFNTWINTPPYYAELIDFSLLEFLSAFYMEEKLQLAQRRAFSSDNLASIIDDFVEKNKERLSWQDVYVTLTGATRIKTSVRFALNRLRENGLVLKEEKNDNSKTTYRSLRPSLLGLLVLLFHRNFDNTEEHFGKHTMWYQLFWPLKSDPTMLDNLMERLTSKYSEDEHLTQLSMEVMNHILDNLELNKDKVVFDSIKFIKAAETIIKRESGQSNQKLWEKVFHLIQDKSS